MVVDVGINADLGSEQTVLVFTGELDASCAADLFQAIVRAQEARRQDVTVDLSGVSFMDSRALATLVRAHRQLATQGFRLRVQNPRAGVAKVLDVTGVTAYLAQRELRHSP